MRGEAMNASMGEKIAVLAVAVALVAAVVVPLRIEAARRSARERSIRTLELTGLMRQGIWTDERVTAANAWRDDFRPARPVLVVGEPVRLRLASADVVHAFALPDLGVAPIEVYPGRPVEVVVVPREAGVFAFYCTTVCGDAHFAMRGVVQVVESSGVQVAESPGGGFDPRDARSRLLARRRTRRRRGNGGAGSLDLPAAGVCHVPRGGGGRGRRQSRGDERHRSGAGGPRPSHLPVHVGRRGVAGARAGARAAHRARPGT